MRATRLAAISLFAAWSGGAMTCASVNAQTAHGMIATGGTEAPPKCAVGGDNPSFGAVYRLVLPRRLNLSGVDRRIRTQDRVTTDPVGSDDKGDDDDDGVRNRKPSDNPEPFHLFYKKFTAATATVPESGDFPSAPDFILVKVIIPAKSEYSFWVQTGSDPRLIQGIAVPKDRVSVDKIICGLRSIKTPGLGRQVATFFIDRTKLQISPISSTPSAPNILFNIIVVPNDFPGTPIIIDPKIYNEG